MTMYFTILLFYYTYMRSVNYYKKAVLLTILFNLVELKIVEFTMGHISPNVII